MIVTATQIKVASLLGLYRFICSAISINKELSEKQLSKHSDIVFIKLKGFRTLSGWSSLEAMKDFRNSGAHLEAMKNLKKIGFAKSVTWESQTEPTWKEAKIRLKSVQFRGAKKS